MIRYDPTSGDVLTTPAAFRPRTCFLITKIGRKVPPIVRQIRDRLSSLLDEVDYDLIDASVVTTGKDFLRKIWDLLISVPVGIAVVYKDMPSATLGNVFYELGVMQALGKDTLIVKESGAEIPSDFVRTEYVSYDYQFDEGIRAFLKSMLDGADYLRRVAESVERNPLLAIDCYRRAFLLTGDGEYCLRTDELLASGEIGKRAKNSVEYLAAGFRDYACRLPSRESARQVAATEARRGR